MVEASRLLLLEEDVRQAAMLAAQRRGQAARARPDDGDVEGVDPGAAAQRPQPRDDHVLDHAAAQVGGVLDQRLAGHLTDQVLARHLGLIELVQLGHLERGRRGALGVHDQRGGGAGPHAGLALDAVLEAQHAALVLDQVEHVGRAHRHAGVAPGAAIVVDRVDQRAHLGCRGGTRRRDPRAAGCAQRHESHDGDRETAEDCRDDQGHRPPRVAKPVPPVFRDNSAS